MQAVVENVLNYRRRLPSVPNVAIRLNLPTPISMAASIACSMDYAIDPLLDAEKNVDACTVCPIQRWYKNTAMASGTICHRPQYSPPLFSAFQRLCGSFFI